MAVSDAKLDQVTQARIGAKLRVRYDGLTDEPVPDHLQPLIRILKDLDCSVALEPAEAPLAHMAPFGNC